jgi:hypothetical protein
MNTKRIAGAYEKIAEGFAALALAYGDMPQPAAGGVPPHAPAPVDFDDLPPLTDADAPEHRSGRVPRSSHRLDRQGRWD